MALRYLSGVSTLQFHQDKCRRCGRCLEVCPHNVFAAGPERRILLQDKDACMECGACMKNCPFGAVTVNPGVGCAYAILLSAATGGPVECGCSGSSCCGT